MRLPAKYLHNGPHHGDGVCIRCGKAFRRTEGGDTTHDGLNAVTLELDQRTGEYHDFGGIPADKSQGGFSFGADCAEAMRVRARAAMATV